LTGLDQYSYSRFAKAFEVFPRILAENCGLNSNEIVPKMISANTDDSDPKGINILNGLVPPTIDTKGKSVEIVAEEKYSRVITSVSELKVYDHRQTKEWALRLASEAAITILRIDQIIVAKPAGGPKPQQNKNWDNDE